MAIPQACKCKPVVAILLKDAYMNFQRPLDVALLVLFSINVQGRLTRSTQRYLKENNFAMNRKWCEQHWQMNPHVYPVLGILGKIKAADAMLSSFRFFQSSYWLTLKRQCGPQWSPSSLVLLPIVSYVKNWHLYVIEAPSLVFLRCHLSLKLIYKTIWAWKWREIFKHLKFCNLPMLWNVQFWRWRVQGGATCPRTKK